MIGGIQEVDGEFRRNKRVHLVWDAGRLRGDACIHSESPRVNQTFVSLGKKAYPEVVSGCSLLAPLASVKDRKSGRTALHLAAEEANLELIRLFLELPSCLSFVNAKVRVESFGNCFRHGMIFFIPSSGF